MSEVNTRFSGNDNIEIRQSVEPTHIRAEAHQLLAEKNTPCNSASASEYLPSCEIHSTTNEKAVDKHNESKSSSHADESDSKSAKKEKNNASGHEHQGGGKVGHQTDATGSSEADDPAALLRRHRLEITEPLSLPPDASSEQITTAKKALNFGLSSNATQAEINQYENDKRSQA
jgi:hypothetical protein